MKPALLVIAGPNGSGKTTITVRLRHEHWSDGVEYIAGHHILDPDLAHVRCPRRGLHPSAFALAFIGGRPFPTPLTHGSR